MQNLLPRTLPTAARIRRRVRVLILFGFALALGACSKCDVPDFTHLGSPTAPHACDSGAPSQ
jgi:hypothetical protein